MPSRNAEWYRRIYRDKSVSGSIAAATAGATDVATAAANHTIWVQKIVVYIVTTGAQTITFQDDNTTPVVAATVPSGAPTGAIYTYDFGARGFGLTSGKNLDISGTAGPAYNYVVEAYVRQTIGTAITVAAAQSA